MKNRKKITKNYIYNLIYQIFTLLTPFVVTPYISRVLGSYGIGQYSFTYSIVTYFVLFAAFGFGYYAQREIARYQGDKIEQSTIFWEIFFARLISVGISLLVYIILIDQNTFGEAYSILLHIFIINIVATSFDITFFFQGNEKFGLIALRNIIVKCVGVVAIICFVKKDGDVWIYALLQSLILIISNLSLWIQLPKYICKISIKSLNIKRHFIPTLRLFIPTIAISIYTMFDRTLIGILVPGETTINGVAQKVADIENGYYEQSEKLVKMAMTIVTSLGTVMIPRNSQAVASGNNEELQVNIESAIKFVFFLGTPIMFGLAAVSFNISPWFFGEGYEKVPYLIMIFCPLILIIGLSNVLGLQYLLPKKEDFKYTISIVSGSIVNLIMNLFLISRFWSIGACIASVIGEIIVTTLMLIFSKDIINIKKLIRISWKYLLAGILMFAIVFSTQYFLKRTIIFSLLLIIEGVVSYFIILLLLMDSTTISFIKRIKRKK